LNLLRISSSGDFNHQFDEYCDGDTSGWIQKPGRKILIHRIKIDEIICLPFHVDGHWQQSLVVIFVVQHGKHRWVELSSDIG